MKAVRAAAVVTAVLLLAGCSSTSGKSTPTPTPSTSLSADFGIAKNKTETEFLRIVQKSCETESAVGVVFKTDEGEVLLPPAHRVEDEANQVTVDDHGRGIAGGPFYDGSYLCQPLSLEATFQNAKKQNQSVNTDHSLTKVDATTFIWKAGSTGEHAEALTYKVADGLVESIQAEDHLTTVTYGPLSADQLKLFKKTLKAADLWRQHISGQLMGLTKDEAGEFADRNGFTLLPLGDDDWKGPPLTAGLASKVIEVHLSKGVVDGVVLP